MTTLLRIENAFLALVALAAYYASGGNWWLFALLILAPDLSMFGYLRGPRVGAYCYNAVHSWVTAVLLYLVGSAAGWQIVAQLALILAAHIGIDRALGFGLKHTSGFRDTHMGRVGDA